MLAPDARVARRRAARRSRTSSTSRSTTASARSSRSQPKGRGPPVVAARQRQDAPVSRDRRRARRRGRRAPHGAARPRRRDRRARREGTAGRLPAAAGPHSPHRRARIAGGARTAFIVFDLLRDGAHRLPRAAAARAARGARTRCFGRTGSPMLRLSEQVRGDGRALYERALDQRLGRPDRQARRLALPVGQAHARLAQAEDRPRAGVRRSAAGPSRANARAYFGALLLGVYDGERSLVYVGHTGTGFNERELARVMKLLKPLETTTMPVQRRRRRPTSGRTGCGPSSSRRSSSPSGPPTASCGIRSISGCATTRRRRTSCASRHDVHGRRPTFAVQRRPSRVRTTQGAGERRTANENANATRPRTAEPSRTPNAERQRRRSAVARSKTARKTACCAARRRTT